MKSRLEGSLDDFVFIKPKVLKLKKAERGTHVKLVTVHRGGKVFQRKQRVGRKEKEVVKKSSLHPDNVQGINDLNESGIVGLVGGIHEMETYIVQFKDGSQAIHKTMMKGDIAGEVGAYEISKIIGWDIIPETIQCNYGKGDGSTQKWIPDGEEPMGDFYDGVDLGEKHLNDLSKIFILDCINSNFDRHDGNLIIDKNDRVWAIDNECIGKKDNFLLHIESLEQYAKNGEGSPMPILRVLENSIGSDIKLWQKFKDHVDKNFKEAILYENKIIDYWDQYKDKKDMKAFLGAIPMRDAIKNIQKNINDAKKYYQKLNK